MRKFSKRVLAVTLSTAMVFSLAACNKSDNSNDTTTSGSQNESNVESTSGNEEPSSTPAADGATYTLCTR